MREASRNCVWDKSWVQQIMHRFESQLQACRCRDQHPNRCSGSCLSIALFALPSHRLGKMNCHAVCILAFTRSQIRSTMLQGIPVFDSVCIAMCSKQLVCLHTFSRLPSWHSLQSSKQIKVFLRRPKFQGVFPDSMLAEKGMQKHMKTQQIQTVVAPKVA